MGLLLALLIAGLAAPESTTLVRYGAGLTLFQEQTSDGDTVRAVDRQGKTVLLERPGEVLRRSRLYDMTVADAGTIAVSVSAPGTLGPAVQEIIEYRASGAPKVIDTGKSVCYQIAADGEGGYWCLGPVLGAGAGYDVLSRWSARGERLGSYIPRTWFARGEGDPEPYQAGESGPPQLMPMGRGVLLAWLPAGNMMATIDARRQEVDRRVMVLRHTGRSMVSFAVGPGGARYAMLPLGQGEETFLTGYKVHRTGPGGSAWMPVPGGAVFPRGSYLLGVDGQALVVWVRAERRVKWVAIE